jgi:hypothetical protein
MMVHVWVIVVLARLATPTVLPETAITLWVPADPQPSCWNANPAPASPPVSPGPPSATMAGGGMLLEQLATATERAGAASPTAAHTSRLMVVHVRPCGFVMCLSDPARRIPSLLPDGPGLQTVPDPRVDDAE